MFISSPLFYKTRIYLLNIPHLEFGSERIPRRLLRGKRANAEQYCSLRIEDSPQLAAESFNPLIVFFIFDSVRSVKRSVNEKKIPISTAIRSFTGFSVSSIQLTGANRLKLQNNFLTVIDSVETVCGEMR
jgi:hypothetical protein